MSLFSYGNIISIIYIYIYCNSHKVWQTQLVRKEKTCKKRVQLFFPPHHVDQVCSCCCWILGRGRGAERDGQGKRMLLKKIKWKRRGLFFSLLLSLLPCLLPPASPSTPLEFSLLESLGSNWYLNRIGGLGALGPTPLNQTLIPALGHRPREPQTPERRLRSRETSVHPADTA